MFWPQENNCSKKDWELTWQRKLGKFCKFHHFTNMFYFHTQYLEKRLSKVKLPLLLFYFYVFFSKKYFGQALFGSRQLTNCFLMVAWRNSSCKDSLLLYFVLKSLLMVLSVYIISNCKTDTRYNRKCFYLPPTNFPVAFLARTSPKIEIRIYSRMVFPFMQSKIVKSTYEPSGSSGRSSSWLLYHEATRSISNSPWMGC